MKKINEQTRLERAERLRNIRKAKGCTIEQFSDILKISKDGYQKIESGENNISLEMLQKCKDSMGISTDYLLFGEYKDASSIWENILNCEEKTKIKIFLRLFHYFSSQKPSVYTKCEVSLENLFDDWIDNGK
jgi:transcriptional regulator with XRE-family HTH domain